MKSGFAKLLADYDYALPRRRIALTPASPRDSAKLLVYDRKFRAVRYDVFSNLGKYLPPGAVLVFNETKVVPARLALYKPTGGKVDALYIGANAHNIMALLDKTVEVGTELSLGRYSFKVLKKINSEYILKPSFPPTKMGRVLERFGQTPLPPYLRHSPLHEAARRRLYQTIFARSPGSVAAPTASLHFTPKLLNTLKRQGVGMAFVTLHVNLGTFFPLTEKQVRAGRLHKETLTINAATRKKLMAWKRRGRPIIAVGTTVVRTLESVFGSTRPVKNTGTTDLFILPGYKFKFVDGLVTNFHVPKSSLMMLVAALVGRQQLLRLYAKAQQHDFRFFSFGDGMLVH